MFGIELDAVKKIEIGVCVVMLSLAGYFFYSGTRTGRDMTVAAWSEVYRVGIDGSTRLTDINPEDPQRSHIKLVFHNNDGRLEFTEYPLRTDGGKAEIHFFHDAAKESANAKFEPPCFASPMQTVKAYTDEVKRAVGMAVIAERAGRKYDLFRNIGVTGKEAEAIRTRYTEFVAAWELIDADVRMGTLDPARYAQCMQVLKEFRDMGEEDPRKMSPKKQKAAQRVMEVTLPYAQRIQEKKLKLVDEFVTSVVSGLSEEQKTKAIEQGRRIEEREKNLRPAAKKNSRKP